MSRELLTGNVAAAWGARLAGTEYVPAFPITPQTEIIETLAGWASSGALAARVVMLESEHSMITAAGAAAATGVRVFSATSSQGLLYALEMLYTVAGWRAPFVLVNVSRGLSSPITLEPDHQDVLAARDTGFLQLHCATCQEVLDAVLLAHRLAEHPHVRVPALVNLDGFYLSFTREPVAVPDALVAREFIGSFAAAATHFSTREPSAQGVAVLGGSAYSYFRYELHLALERALAVFDEVAADFEHRFGRGYDSVGAYRADDAELVFVMIGSFSTKAKAAVDALRGAGWSVGLVRPFLLRPFPQAKLRALLSERRVVIVVDQNLGMGKGGILHTEIGSALYGLPRPPLLLGFVGGLGGRDISEADFFEMARVARHALDTGIVPPPRLLYNRAELGALRALQAIARAREPEGPSR